MIFRSMKGRDCPYKSIVCQEGFCEDCQIYLDYQGHEKTMGRSISSSIYPIEWLRKTIEKKRDEAFAETAYGSREHKLQLQAMVNAYDICLRLMERGK